MLLWKNDVNKFLLTKRQKALKTQRFQGFLPFYTEGCKLTPL
jgi:hypothetical protein